MKPKPNFHVPFNRYQSKGTEKADFCRKKRQVTFDWKIHLCRCQGNSTVSFDSGGYQKTRSGTARIDNRFLILKRYYMERQNNIYEEI